MCCVDVGVFGSNIVGVAVGVAWCIGDQLMSGVAVGVAWCIGDQSKSGVAVGMKGDDGGWWDAMLVEQPFGIVAAVDILGTSAVGGLQVEEHRRVLSWVGCLRPEAGWVNPREHATTLERSLMAADLSAAAFS